MFNAKYTVMWKVKFVLFIPIILMGCEKEIIECVHPVSIKTCSIIEVSDQFVNLETFLLKDNEAMYSSMFEVNTIQQTLDETFIKYENATIVSGGDLYYDYAIHYSYNDDGELSAWEAVTDYTKEVFASALYEYPASDIVEKTVFINEIKNEQIQYDLQGNIIKYTRYDGGGFVHFTFSYENTFNEEGNISTRALNNPDGTIKTLVTYSYDNGLISKIKKHDVASGDNIVTITYDYNEEGLIREVKTFLNPDYSVTAPLPYFFYEYENEYVYEYRDHGTKQIKYNDIYYTTVRHACPL